ncbi:toxin-antitoxin system YwqK family antitoxin [Ekhidna sp.]
MNKTQILIALVILSIFGVISTYLDVHKIWSQDDQPVTKERKLRHGEIKQYTKDKRLKTVVNYDNGIKHGTSYLYHNDGKTVLLAMPYNQGKREGVSKKYYQNGKLYAATTYKNDVLHGPRQIYYTSGQLKAEIMYGYGKPGIGSKEFLKDGTQKPENKIIATKLRNSFSLSTSEECKESKFYIGKLIEDNFFDPLHPDVKLLTKEDATYVVDLNLYTPSYLKYQDIICECDSKQGNTIIMKTRLY